MRAKEFFQQVRIAEEEIQSIQAKIAHYEAMGLPKSGMGGSGSHGTRSSSRVEIGAVAAADAMTDLEDQLARYQDIVNRAESIIKQIPQVKYRTILSYHYVCGKTLRWISDELDYGDPNSIYRAHGWALAEAQRIMDKQSK